MSYNPSIDHYHIIKEERAKLTANMISAEDSVRVLNSAVKRFRSLGEDAGLLEKSSGNRGCFSSGCYSVDCVCYPDGRLFDALIDAGSNDQAGNQVFGKADPAWSEIEPIDPDRYRPPSDEIPALPGDEPPEQSVPTVVCPQWSPVTYGRWMDECRMMTEVYKNTDHNPEHLDPSPTDVNHWGWRRFIELWTFENMVQDIKHPGSVANGICSGAPK